MTEKDLFEALNDLDDSILEDSEKETKPVEIRRIKKGTIIAICSAIAVSLAIIVIFGILVIKSQKGVQLNSKLPPDTSMDMSGYTGSVAPTMTPGDNLYPAAENGGYSDMYLLHPSTDYIIALGVITGNRFNVMKSQNKPILFE